MTSIQVLEDRSDPYEDTTGQPAESEASDRSESPPLDRKEDGQLLVRNHNPQDGELVIDFPTKAKMVNGCCCFWFGIFLILILTLVSYHRIWYYEIALVRRVTGTVEYDHLLTQGRQYLVLGKTPIRFPATQQRITFLQAQNDPLVVFSEQGLEFDFNLVFCYKIIPERVGDLYYTYGTVYDDRIKTISLSLLKDQATKYTTDQYIRDRDTITSDFAMLLKTELEKIMPIHISLDLVVLLQINFPQTLVRKNMEATLEIQNNILEQNQQAVNVIQADTQVQVATLAAETNYTIAKAEIDGNRTIAQAQANAIAIEQNADAEGLLYAIQTLNLTLEEADHLWMAMTLRRATQTQLIDMQWLSPLLFQNFIRLLN